jgi:ATP-dependent DNA helicase RecG
LPNRNEKAPVPENTVPRREEESYHRQDAEAEKELLLSYAREKGVVTRKETEELLEIGSTKAFKILKKLCDAGYLKAEGRGRLSKYVVNN